MNESEGPAIVPATFSSPATPHGSKDATASGWRRKNNRLSPDRYVGNSAYSLTFVTEARLDAFTDSETVHSIRSALEAAADKEGFTIPAFVFMPDHLHLLISGSDDANLPAFTKRFKQSTAYWFKRRTGQQLWQKSYHDHIARQDEDLNEIALYIAGNPVRAGLVEDWWAYPYIGGSLLTGALAGDLKVAATSKEPLA
jgi:putative transposase